MRVNAAQRLIASAGALALVFVPFLASSTGALASELGDRWQGAYAGALVGGSYISARVERGPGQDDRTFDDTEPAVGLFVGYNTGSGSSQWRIGIEADLTYASHNRIESDQILDDVQLRHRWMGSVRGRAGYVRGNDFVYGTMGLAISDLEIEPENLGPHDAIRAGLIVGLGGERAFADRWSARVEGLAAFYPDDDIGFAGVERTVEHRQATVRFGLVRRF